MKDTHVDNDKQEKGQQQSTDVALDQILILEGGREEKVSEEDYHIPDGRKKMNEVANSILPIDWTIHSDTGRTQLT
jgi:hypothetical protein